MLKPRCKYILTNKLLRYTLGYGVEYLCQRRYDMLPCVIYYSEPNIQSNPNLEVYKSSLSCGAIEQILNIQKSSPHSRTVEISKIYLGT